MKKWYHSIMMERGTKDLHATHSPGAQVSKTAENSWHLEIPASMSKAHRLAQLDDHGTRLRSNFPWKAPLVLTLKARVSAADIPGTWGFGLWNEPFSLLRSHEGWVPRMPTLPNAAWFFYASPPNDLSLRDDLPPDGFMAATFRAKNIAFPLLALTLPYLGLSIFPGTAQLVRRSLRRVVQQDSALINTTVTQWHEYTMKWDAKQVLFTVDGTNVFQTNITPHGPMSLVLWIDNQYAALPPRGGLRAGSLPNPEPAWLEMSNFSVQESG